MSLVKKNDVNIIVELVGGSDGIARKLVQSALDNGKHVITANKALMAKHGNSLSLIAEKKRSQFQFVFHLSDIH